MPLNGDISFTDLRKLDGGLQGRHVVIEKPSINENFFIIKEICDQGPPHNVGTGFFKDINFTVKKAKLVIHIDPWSRSGNFDQEAAEILIKYAAEILGVTAVHELIH